MKEYKRLTNGVKLEKKQFIGMNYGGDTCYEINDEALDLVINAINRLAELEDKIENGTFIELPCKVGDTIYIVSNKIEKFIVTALSIDITKYRDWGTGCIQFANENGYRAFDYNAYFSWIGKSVFLSKAEAEQRLKDLKGEV